MCIAQHVGIMFSQQLLMFHFRQSQSLFTTEDMFGRPEQFSARSTLLKSESNSVHPSEVLIILLHTGPRLVRAFEVFVEAVCS